MNVSRRLVSGSALRVVQFATQIGVVFVMMPFVMRTLGSRNYGLWILISAAVGYTALMDMGLSSGVARYISRAAGRGDDAEINKVFNTALGLFLQIGGVVFEITIIGASLCWLLLTDDAEARTTGLAVLLLGARMALKFPARTFDGVLTAHLRYDLQAVATLTGFLVMNAGIYFALHHGGGIVAMAAAVAGGGLLEYALTIWFAWRAYPKLRVARGAADAEVRRALFSFSWKTMLWQLAVILRFKVDSPVIAHGVGREFITPYNPGSQLNNYFYEFVTTVIGNTAPLFSRHESKGDFTAIRAQFLVLTRMSACLAMFIGGSILFYSHAFILRWIGPHLSQLGGQNSWNVAMILALGYTLILVQTPSSSLLYGISKHHLGAFNSLGEGVLNLVLSLVLVRHYGIYGVAWATTISAAVNQLFIYPVIVCRAVELPCMTFFGELGLVMAKCAALLGIYFYALQNFLRPDYFTLAAMGVAQALLFAPACYFLVLREPEKTRLNHLVKDALGKFLSRRSQR
jgi:O-antigen/teichoic acid export membrane protein